MRRHELVFAYTPFFNAFEIGLCEYFFTFRGRRLRLYTLRFSFYGLPAPDSADHCDINYVGTKGILLPDSAEEVDDHPRYEPGICFFQGQIEPSGLFLAQFDPKLMWLLGNGINDTRKPYLFA